MPSSRAVGALKLSSPAAPPDSPDMSESEPFLTGWDRSASNSPTQGRRPPPIGLGLLGYGSPSPLGVSRYSSAPNSPSLPPYSSPTLMPQSAKSGFFNDIVPPTPTTAVAVVAGNRRFRLLAFSAVAILAIIGFASLGAADPQRLQQHVVEPVKDVWHAAGHVAHQGVDAAKSWMGFGSEVDYADAMSVHSSSPLEQAENQNPLDQASAHSADDSVPVVPEDKAQEAEPKQEDAPPVIADEDAMVTSEAFTEPTASIAEPAPTTTQVELPPALPTSHKLTDDENDSSKEVAPEAEPSAHALYVLPDPPRVPQGGPDEKFFAYLPHSGFHNQRIELANAMALAFIFKRTLLVPPVWIGWPQTTLDRKRLQAVWDKQMDLHPESFAVRAADAARHLEKRQSNKKQGKSKAKAPAASKAPSVTKPPKKLFSVEECKSYAKECRSTYQDTFVAWSFLTDLDLAGLRVPLIDRFNMSEAFMYEITGATPNTTYVLEDEARYWYQFFDSDPNDEAMIVPWDFDERKYYNRASLPKLIEATKDYKLITMGSTFGSTRLMLENPVNSRALNYFHRSLAFRNHVLDEPSNRIRDLMGGAGNYVGVHARVGDGQFMLHAQEYMQRTFEELVFEKLKVDKSLLDSMLTKGRELADTYPEPTSVPHRRRGLEPRSPSPWADMETLSERDGLVGEETEAGLLVKRQGKSLAVPDRASSPLDKTLTCRRPLHTDPALFALNAPLYIATDSAHPLEDRALAIFFANFPCSFILADFDKPSEFNSGPPVTSLRSMELATNVNDGVKLGRLLLPFMEAAVAAKSGAVSGTNGSTFSAFAAGPLHRAYQDDQENAGFNEKR